MNEEFLASVVGELHDALIEQVARLGAVEEGFALAQWLCSFLVANPCGIYRSDALEDALLQDGMLLSSIAQAEPAPKKQGVLHVLSQPYQHGGHTRVARHLISQGDAFHSVLLTRWPVANDAHHWLEIRPDQLLVEPAQSTRQRIISLAQSMSAHEELILYLHPDDVVGALAVRLAKRMCPDLRVGFFNHSDHSFSVAIGCADHVFEISTYGWQLRHARGIEARASFVGIPITVTSPIESPMAAPRHGKSILLAGTPYKFKPVGQYSLLPVLDRLLASDPEISIDFAGPDGREKWWQPLCARYTNRLRFHGFVGHDQYMAMLSQAAFFVDSFPKTGGTAFPEALLSGANVIALQGGTWGFSLADALRVSDVAAFLERSQAVVRADAGVLAHMGAIRQECKAFHSPASVWQRIQTSLIEGICQPPPETLSAMPPPPILAEEEWLGHGRIQMLLPNRKSPHAKRVHRIVMAAHSQIRGPFHPGTMRLAATWLARYAGRLG